MLDKYFSEIFLAYCGDTQQRPERELALNLKQLLDKRCNSEKFVMRSQRIGLGTASSLARYFAQVNSKENPLLILDLHENVIRDKGVQALMDELKSLNTLKVLDFGSNDLGSESALLLAEYLKSPDCTLETLLLGSDNSDLYANKIDAEGGVAIAEALVSNFTLNTLDFNRNHQLGKKTQQAFFALADAFDENKTIACLRLGQTSMGSVAAINVIQSLEGNENLRYLDIHGNKLSMDIAESLGKMTCSCPSLSVLLLHDNNIKNRGTEILCNYLQAESFLTVLNLAGNGITNDGAFAISNYLSSRHTLTYLNISHNQIAEEGIESIAAAINNPQSCLHTLIVSNNRMGNGGAKALAKCVEYDQCGIVNLELNACGIGDSGAVALCLALTCNTNLLYLKMHNNHISEEAGLAIVDLLEKNHTIVSFDVRGNQLDHPTYLKIKKLMQRNKTDKMLVEPNKLRREVIRLKYVRHLLEEASKELEYQENVRHETTSKVERISERIKVISEETDASANEIIVQIQEEQKRIDYYQNKIATILEEKKKRDEISSVRWQELSALLQKEQTAKEELEHELNELKLGMADAKRKKEIETRSLQEKIKSTKIQTQDMERRREKCSMDIVDMRVRLHDLEMEYLEKFGSDQQEKINVLYQKLKMEDEELFAKQTSMTTLLQNVESFKKTPRYLQPHSQPNISQHSESSSSIGSKKPTVESLPIDSKSSTTTSTAKEPKTSSNPSTGRKGDRRKSSPPASSRRQSTSHASTTAATTTASTQPPQAQPTGKMRVTNLSIYDSNIINK